MPDEIYVVDPATGEAKRHGPTSFAEIGIHERSDLQEWILAHPEILGEGESLLVVTSEFSGFDRSNRRLDLLALDDDRNLVVIELKLALDRTFADLQALRYAAFCSTMTLDQVLREYASYHGVSRGEASSTIARHLGVDDDDLPEPSDRPRIMLVAGSMDEPEAISTVLWLRNFDLDIRCLEVTPYQIGGEEIVLVPRSIVPLPEAEEYQVRVERKESARAQKERTPSPYAPLWQAIADEYAQLDTLLDLTSKPGGTHLKIRTGDGDFHYEWQVRKTAGLFHVAVHFESRDGDQNQRYLKLIQEHEDQIVEGVDVPFEAVPWGTKWTYGAFEFPLEVVLDDPQAYSRKAAKLMDHLIRRTWPVLTG